MKNLRYKDRASLAIATSVALAKQGRMPLLLSNSGDTFRFEGGMIVKVAIGHNDEQPIKRWWVAEVATRRVGEKEWTRVPLEELKSIKDSSCGWYHPHISNIY